jgi:putative ABC transport system permease protein
VSDLAEHVRLIDGAALPKAEPLRDARTPPALSVWIGKATADRLGVHVGDTFELHPYWKLDAAPVQVTVVGVVEPRDLSERYWQQKTDRFEMTTTWPTYPFFVGEEAFLNSLAVYLPDLDGSFETCGLVDPARVNSRNARGVEGRLGGLDGALREAIPRTSAETALPGAIETYRTKLFFTRLPLFALMLQIVGIVLYYLVMVATMLIEKQSGEIALLRSRGASSLQIITVFGIEGAFLCGSAAVAGPFVATGAIAALGLTPPFQDLSGGGYLDVPFSRQAVGMSVLGAGLAFAAILWPAYRAARNSVVDYKRQVSRPQQQPSARPAPRRH